MFISILLLVFARTFETKDTLQQPSGSTIERIMRLTQNLDITCLRGIQLKEESPLVGYVSCEKTNTVPFQTTMFGMIRSFYFSKVQRLTCMQPSCSIRKPWDGTGLCKRLNRKELSSRINISYISSSSRYSKIVYGIEDHLYTTTRLMTLELEPGAGNCGHVVRRPGKNVETVYDTMRRTTCGLTVGQCLRENTDKSCIFICMCAFLPPTIPKRICQTRIIEEPEFDGEDPRSPHHFHTIFQGSDSILSISMEKKGRLFVLTYSTHQLLVKTYKLRHRWELLKESPISKGTLSFAYSDTNSKILMIKKKSVDIHPISKTIRKEEDDLVCWCHNVNKVVIVNRLCPFVRRIVSI